MKFAYFVTTTNHIGIATQIVPVYKRIRRHPVH
jgi:hypothetical protein